MKTKLKSETGFTHYAFIIGFLVVLAGVVGFAAYRTYKDVAVTYDGVLEAQPCSSADPSCTDYTLVTADKTYTLSVTNAPTIASGTQVAVTGKSVSSSSGQPTITVKSIKPVTAGSSSSAASSSSTNSTNLTPSTPPSSRPGTTTTAGWDTYASSLIPVSFKYPATWTAQTTTSGSGSSESSSTELTAPTEEVDGASYKFSMTFNVKPATHLVGVAIPHYVYYSTKLVDSDFPQTLYVLTEGPGSVKGTDSNEACVTVLNSSSISPGNYDAGFDRIYVSSEQFTFDGGVSGCFEPSEYISLPEVQQAEQVFSTLTEN